MTYTYITPKDTLEIQAKFVEWLNSNLIDPYETSTQHKRTNFVLEEDNKLTNILPIIQFDISDYVPTKISTQSKTTYLEEEEHHFLIYYHNQKAHRYTFEDGKTYTDQLQNMKYLQYIKNKIKQYAGDFSSYCHKITFGNISKPKWTKLSNCYIGMLPMTVFTYRR